MDDQLLELVRSLLAQNLSPDQVKNMLEKKGFLEEDINSAIGKAGSVLSKAKDNTSKTLAKKLAWKEVLDRIGYGFVSHPFLNILFFFSGASYFLIGAINGIRTVLSLIFSSYLKEFFKSHEISKNFISRAGILYGFSFLVISFAIVLKSPGLYALAFLFGSLGVVAHGEIYSHFLRSNLRKEKMSAFMSKISKYGVLITLISLMLSGYVMDLFPMKGKLISFSLLGMNFNWTVYGYLISFEITAFAFIFSGMILAYIKQKTLSDQASLTSFIKPFMSRVRAHLRLFSSNKVIILLSISSLLTGLVQVIGNSFYGIFIFNHFKNQFLGGFLNVALVFSIAIIASFIGPWFTRNLHNHIGVSPMLVFGSLLVAMLPVSLAYNPHIAVVSVASALSVIGASILGMAQGYFTKKLLSEEERQVYFSFVGLAITVPMLILAPLGALLAQVMGLVFLFKIIILLLVFVATPLYLLIVLLYERTLEQTF